MAGSIVGVDRHSSGAHCSKALQKFGLLSTRKIILLTLSKRQASSTVTTVEAPSSIKLLEYNAKAHNVSAAALRVAQSVLPRHS